MGQCHRALQESVVSPTLARNKCFHMLDAFVRLVALMVKHSGDATNAFVKINLLNKVCIEQSCRRVVFINSIATNVLYILVLLALIVIYKRINFACVFRFWA